MLSVVMLNVVMLNVVMLNVVMLNVAMLNYLLLHLLHMQRQNELECFLVAKLLKANTLAYFAVKEWSGKEKVL